MSQFRKAVENQTTTTNGMSAFKSTTNACLDLFFTVTSFRSVPSSRTWEAFERAFNEHPDTAVRIVLWARDIRGGAGERKFFRDIITEMYYKIYASESSDSWVKYKDVFQFILNKTSEVGRWDDLLCVIDSSHAKSLIWTALNVKKDGLCAKWMPRKGEVANKVRKSLRLNPKEYRKLLVSLTDVVETKMCNREWEDINYSHVPSVASSRYKKAFLKNSQAYKTYLELLKSGDTSVKINASAIFPHDIIKEYLLSKVFYNTISESIKDSINAQWNALPDIGSVDAVLPVIDVSGSMTTKISNKSTTTCMEVAVGMGLYMSMKNKGSLHGVYSTFSGTPNIKTLDTSSVCAAINSIDFKDWGSNTNIIAVAKKITNLGKVNSIPNEEMPKTIVIMSDMQFDTSQRYGNSKYSFDEFKEIFEKAGYDCPVIVYWYINGTVSNNNRLPVLFNTPNVVAITGFTPAIAKAVLNGTIKDMNPHKMMMDIVGVERYSTPF